MTIKHLVLSGGGPSGFITYGAIKHLQKNNVWNLKNIKSIYGCSIGAILGIIISLGYEWDWIDDYLIKRPWHKLIETGFLQNITFLKKKGIVEKNFFKEILRPLLNAKEINIDATMQDLYNITKIELHIFSTSINSNILKKIDISHKTHSSLKIVDAIAMSAALPILFEPICIDNECYVDGGFLNNYPLNDCLINQKCKEKEILAFKNKYEKKNNIINTNSNFFDFILAFLNRWFNTLELNLSADNPVIENTVICLIHNSAESWTSAWSSEKYRAELIENGEKQGSLYLD